MTKERSRKPSVLVSRKFSCADNLDISTVAKPSDPSHFSKENDPIQIKLQALTFSDESLWIKEAVEDVKAKIAANNISKELRHKELDSIPLFEDSENRRAESDPVELTLNQQSKTTPSLVTKEQYSTNSIKQHNLIQSDVIDKVTTATNTVPLDTMEDSTMCKLTEEEDGDKKEHELIVDAIEEIVQTLKTENSNTIWKGSEKPQTLQVAKLAMLKKRLYNSNTTVATLLVLEKAVQQNNFRNEQIHYKGVPIAPFSSESEEISNAPLSLQYLFEFKSDATHKRIVTSMSFHSISKDILAVGYENGENEIDEDGFVLLWSLRNPSFPFSLKFGPVTALAFSQESPTVLAVGQSNGIITLLDTTTEKMVTTSNGSSEFQHWNAIVDLKWVKEKGQELLLSTSIDGKVLLWSTQKGLTSQPLATLKQNLHFDYKSFESYQDHKNATIETKPPGMSLPSEFLIKLKTLLQKKMDNEEMTKVVFSPDEKLLFVGDVLGRVKVFKVWQ